MSNRKVSIGLIGAGLRLRSVTKLLKEVAGDAARISVVYDPEPSSAQAVREEFGQDVYIARSEEEAVEKSDWVFIGSFNSEHARQAVLALNAGRDVFCEKPLATNLEDCLAVRDAVKRSGRTFFFGLVLRFAPLYGRVWDLLRQGTIGELVSFEFNETLSFNHGGYIFGNWRRDRALAGTHVLEKCCHDLDLANWLVGSIPISAGSFGGRNIFLPENAYLATQIGRDEAGRLAYSVWPNFNGVDPFSGAGDIMDNQVAILKYANGVNATFHTNCNSAMPERRFHLCGTEGTLQADAYKEQIIYSRMGFDSEIVKIDASGAAGQGGHAGGDRKMAAALAQTMLHGAPVLSTVEDGLRACVAAFAIDEALDQQRIVNLSELWEKIDLPLSPSSAPSLQPAGLA